MQQWKILSLSLFAAFWTACENGGIEVHRCVPVCELGQECVDGRCVDVVDPNPQPVEKDCKTDRECENEICTNEKCAPAQCGTANTHICPDFGICVDNRCYPQCRHTADCPFSACVDGVCVPFDCSIAPCNRMEACVDAEDDNVPSKGKCQAVQCLDENGDYACDPDPLKERCVGANNPQNPILGTCRTLCIIPHEGGSNLCGQGFSCRGIASQIIGKNGTCEAGCFRSGDCREWDFCENADVVKLTPGVCREFLVSAGECRDKADCSAWETCEDADATTLQKGECTEVTKEAGKCRFNEDCAAATPVCRGADAENFIQGQCE